MSYNDTIYRVMSTKECLNYLKSFGLTIHDDDMHLLIKSGKGVVYPLPNGEVLLVPTNFNKNYPGIIFKSKKEFEHCVKEDFFPIGEENMTWLERNYHQMKTFETDRDFFSIVLIEKLGLKLPFQNLDDVKTAFVKIKEIIKRKNSIMSKDAEELVHTFGLSLICYLKDYRQFEILKLNEHENYNPYIYPMVINRDYRIDVLSKVIRYIYSDSTHSFDSLVLNIQMK